MSWFSELRRERLIGRNPEPSALASEPVAPDDVTPLSTGLPPAPGAAGARAYFGKEVAVYLDDGPRDGEASSVVIPGPPLEVLRAGPISREELRSALD